MSDRNEKFKRKLLEVLDFMTVLGFDDSESFTLALNIVRSVTEILPKDNEFLLVCKRFLAEVEILRAKTEKHCNLGTSKLN